jgi:hypothetical protein
MYNDFVPQQCRCGAAEGLIKGPWQVTGSRGKTDPEAISRSGPRAIIQSRHGHSPAVCPGDTKETGRKEVCG